MGNARTFIRNLAAIGRIPPRDLPAVFRMGVTACSLPLLEHLMSLPSLVSLLDTSRRSQRKGDPDRIVELAGKILARNIGPFKPGCFRRSLILFAELRRIGWPARIVFGIREHDDALDGHAWVELDGAGLGETVDPSSIFRTVYSYPADEPGEGTNR